MTRLFTGDYSTGDFSQWYSLGNKFATTGLNHGNEYPRTGFYPAATISEDKDCGYIARYELRTGDRPDWDSVSVDRSETFGKALSAALVGDTTWYAMSIKFAADFPTDHQALGSGIVTQFHDHPSALSSPVLALGWALPGTTGFRSGYWYLRHNPQAAPLTFLGAQPLFEFPFNPGQWHDIKLQIKWAQDNAGFVNLWWNGVRQTLLTGGQTFTGQTLCPSGVGPANEILGATIQQGYYRASIAPTGVVYHTGFRMADSEASL